MLGLATKAGKLFSGEGACEKYIKSGKAKLVIVAEDASDNTRKKFKNMCEYRNIDLFFFGLKEDIGRYTGKGVRSVVVITDNNFADGLRKILSNINQ